MHQLEKPALQTTCLLFWLTSAPSEKIDVLHASAILRGSLGMHVLLP